MKPIIKTFGILLTFIFLFSACQDEDQQFDELIAPSNVNITVTYLEDTNDDGIQEEVPAPGLGSGLVRFNVTADNALGIRIIVQGQSKFQQNPADGVEHIFTELGQNTYNITAIVTGTGGASTTSTINLDVLSLYEPPQDLLEMLRGTTGQRTWRIKNEASNHFGLGPVGAENPFQFFGAGPNDKEGVGMYDDRYIFTEDGQFIHIVDNTNDDPSVDVSGTVFGREVLINELGGAGGGTQNGADIENYEYEDYTEQWTLTAPGGVETLNLTGIAFLGYYIGGNHQYQIQTRSANEMTVRSTDGNNQFDWGFVLIADD